MAHPWRAQFLVSRVAFDTQNVIIYPPKGLDSPEKMELSETKFLEKTLYSRFSRGVKRGEYGGRKNVIYVKTICYTDYSSPAFGTNMCFVQEDFH